METNNKREIQILKSIIENDTAQEKILPFISDTYFTNIGNAELVKLMKKHPGFRLNELELLVDDISNIQIRTEIFKSLQEVNKVNSVREEIVLNVAENFIIAAMKEKFLQEAADSLMRREDFSMLEAAKAIEDFSLKPRKCTKSLAEIENIPFEDYKWHCLNFIPVIEGKLIMITGRGASGKGISMLRNAIEYLAENAEKRALLWNMEDSINDIKNRIMTLKESGLSVAKHVFERLEVLDTTKKFSLNELKVQFEDFEYIVIDPISHLIEGDENDAAKIKPVMKFFQNLCNESNKTIILVHHEAKGTDGKGNRQARGSSAFFDNARLCYSIRYDEGKYHVETVKNNYGEFRGSFEITPWHYMHYAKNANGALFASDKPNSKNDEENTVNSALNEDWGE